MTPTLPKGLWALSNAGVPWINSNVIPQSIPTTGPCGMLYFFNCAMSSLSVRPLYFSMVVPRKMSRAEEERRVTACTPNSSIFFKKSV